MQADYKPIWRVMFLDLTATKQINGMKNKTKMTRSKKKELMQAMLFILPQIVGFLVFSLYPIIWVTRYAWYNYDGVIEKFTGFNNIINVFTNDINYWYSVINTLILGFGKLAIELPLALALAIILNSNIKGRSFFRTVFFMPNIISVAIMGVIYYFMFATFEGIVNNMLIASNVMKLPINWFGEKWTAMAVLAIASIWQNFGINMLFFLAGLMNIPKELYECAEIDGADKFTQFKKITIPMLAPIMQVIVMMGIIGSIKTTDLVLVLTNGQPAGGTEVVMTYIFKKFFSYGDMNTIPQIGYSCALGLVTSIILGLITIVYLRQTKKYNTID